MTDLAAHPTSWGATWDRFGQLAGLDPGWGDGTGIPPALPALATVSGLLAATENAGLTPCRLTATPDGAIHADWAGTVTVTVTVAGDHATLTRHSPGSPTVTPLPADPDSAAAVIAAAL